MTLTAAQQALIEKPFALNEHGFKGQHVYLLKSAIRRRLNDVDRDWREDKPELLTDSDPDVVSIALPLTIAGVTRVGVGVGIINRWITNEKTGEITGELEGFKLALEKSKARKSAATDALTRAFNEFNGGVYLKDKPNSIKKDGFADWLAKLPIPSTHWSANGGRERVSAFMKKIGLEWKVIADLVEPGHTLSGLSETTLDEAGFMARLAELAFKPAAPQIPPSAPSPAPAPAPETDDPPRYGGSPSATTSTSVAPPVTASLSSALTLGTPRVTPFGSSAPAAGKVEDLNKWFPESSGTAQTTKVTTHNALGFRTAQRTADNPTGKGDSITWIRVLPNDIAVDDVYESSDDKIARVLEVQNSGKAGVCRWLISEHEARGGSPVKRIEEKSSSLGQITVVGGPKLKAVNNDVSLVQTTNGSRLWIGTKNAQAAS